MIAVSDRDRANGERYLHAWNIVQLGGQCYHLDATFDNSLSKYGTRYDYFNLDDTKIFRDHRPLLYPAPPCTDGGQFYYKLQHLSWTKPEEVARRVDQALRKKQPGLVFHWRGGYLTREVLAELCLQIDAAAQARGGRRPFRSTGRRRCCRCTSSMRPSRWKRSRLRTSEALPFRTK